MQKNLLSTVVFFWASFCEIVRIVSNSRNCTYKLHIKEEKDINAYSVDAIDLFKSTLQYNIKKYNEFYSELQKRGHLKKDGASYKGQVKIILGDAFTYLKHSRQKYSLVFTSPPYGDNHTTVSYGQYSIMPLRWINYKDIDEAVDNSLLSTLYEIDNQSLGGKSANKFLTPERKKVIQKSETLRVQLDEISNVASEKGNKIIAFYSDYDNFLATLSRKLKPNAIICLDILEVYLAFSELSCTTSPPYASSPRRLWRWPGSWSRRGGTSCTSRSSSASW